MLTAPVLLIFFVGGQVTPKTVREEEWAEWNCPLGWAARGCWPQGADGTELASVSRSASGKLLAAGDDFGHVRVFAFPAAAEAAGAVSGRAHAAGVAAVAFAGDGLLVSAGGGDRTVMQWRVAESSAH